MLFRSPAQSIRMIFDLLPLETKEQRQNWAQLTADVPHSLSTWQSALQEGMAAGLVAAKRQAQEVAQQCAAFGNYYVETAASFSDIDASQVADNAKQAFDEVSHWLSETYLPACLVNDGVGRPRYEREVRKFTGASIDVLELWQWGWDELDRITARMEVAAEKLYPGVTLSDVLVKIEHDERYLVHGRDNIVKFLEDLTARTTEEMRAHFTIPDSISQCDVKLAGDRKSTRLNSSH